MKTGRTNSTDALAAVAPRPTLRLVRKEQTPEALVQGLQRGDPQAAAELFRVHARRIEGLVWRVLGPDADYQDIVQQVYLAIASSIGGLKDPAALSSWIIGVTFNTLKKELRRRSRRPRLELLDNLEDAQELSAKPSDHALTASFYRVFAQLSAEDRCLLALRFMEGTPLAELAEASDCSLATAKRRLRRARRRFKKHAAKDFWLAAVVARMEGDTDV